MFRVESEGVAEIEQGRREIAFLQAVLSGEGGELQETLAVLPSFTLGRLFLDGSVASGQVGQVAADIRSLRPPDPYKQKGVRITGERLKKKAGKAGAKAGGA